MVQVLVAIVVPTPVFPIKNDSLLQSSLDSTYTVKASNGIELAKCTGNWILTLIFSLWLTW